MNRIKKLQKLILKQDLVGLIVDDPIDLFYLTGLDLSLGRLLVGKEEAHLFVDGRYFEACKRLSSLPVYPSEKKGFEKFLQSWRKGRGKLGFDSSYTSFQNFLELSALCKGKFSLEPWEKPLAQLRVIKDKEEIAIIKKAATLNGKALLYAASLLKEGITEEEIAQEIELYFLKHGGEKNAFKPIVAFGENAAECHYRPSMKRKLKKGDCVLIDQGVVINHYNSDLTRTFFFGPPHKEVKKIYKIVYKALHEALKKCRPQTTLGELDEIARTIIEEEGYGKFYPHGLGHGVGLEIHEYPRVKNVKPFKDVPLEEGMVITIEPGIYLPGVGGVRLEELIVITKTGYKDLTNIGINEP